MRRIIYILFSTVVIVSLAHTNDVFKYIQPVSVEKRNVLSTNTFIDADNDGILDTNDKCLNTPPNTKVDLLGCILLHDDDNDGISNRNDKCPKTKPNTLVNSDGCEPDDDHDGIINTRDECPNTSAEFLVNTVGCPQTAALNINFENAQSKIASKYTPQIEEFVRFLQSNTNYQAIIYGYTQDLDETKEPKLLAQKRANALMNLLIKHGVKLTRLTAIGIGLNKATNNEASNTHTSIKIDLLQ